MRHLVAILVFLAVILVFAACAESSSGTISSAVEITRDEMPVEEEAVEEVEVPAEVEAVGEEEEPIEEQTAEAEEEAQAEESTDIAEADTTATFTLEATSEHECWIVTEQLNIRSGPGTEYDTIRSPLHDGEYVKPLARNSDATWIRATTEDMNTTGWISGREIYTQCNFDKMVLPLETASLPAPSATTTATRTPSPMPSLTHAPSPSPTITPSPTPDLHLGELTIRETPDPLWIERLPPDALSIGGVISAFDSCEYIITHGCESIENKFRSQRQEPYEVSYVEGRDDVCMTVVEKVDAGDRIFLSVTQVGGQATQYWWDSHGDAICRYLPLRGIVPATYDVEIRYKNKYVYQSQLNVR